MRPSCQMKTPSTLVDRPSTDNLAICLTDPPAVVELKREFYDLDLRTEALKFARVHSAQAETEYQHVQERKAEIAREIFGRNLNKI